MNFKALLIKTHGDKNVSDKNKLVKLTEINYTSVYVSCYLSQLFFRDLDILYLLLEKYHTRDLLETKTLEEQFVLIELEK